jgi:signal peptidase II
MISYLKRLKILIFVWILCLGSDQITKYIAKKLLLPGSVISLMGDTIRLQYLKNKGAFLSLGASLPEETRFWIFMVWVSLMLNIMFFYLILSKKLSFLPTLGISLIFSGAMSNLIDRLTYDGAVIDFLNIGIGNLRTGVFNLADFTVICGVALLFYFSLFKGGTDQSTYTSNTPLEENFSQED